MAQPETLGKYEIKRQLGRGAMGTVYEGWDPIIERRVAIKTVNLPDASDPETEEALARFRREAQAAGRLTHPNIVGVFDYGETGEVAYIVMEYIDGPPLKNLLDKQERFTIATTVRIMDDLLAGLKFSHDRGVVHRDIKPANVMLTSEGQAKIADFGIARIESSSMTQAGTVLGTPAYMSPEQIMGQVVDARSDIYSSGVLLYQLLTGERPFEGGMSAIMHKALNTEAPLPSQISVTSPTPFDAVVRKAMAKRPEDRFANAAEFAAAVREAASGRAPAPTPAEDDQEATMVMPSRSAARPAPPPPPPPPVTPRPVAAAATPEPKKKSMLPAIIGGVILLLLLAGGGAYFFVFKPKPIPPGPEPGPGTVIPPGPSPGPGPGPITPPGPGPSPGPGPVTPPGPGPSPGPSPGPGPGPGTITPPGPGPNPGPGTITPPGPGPSPGPGTVTPPEPGPGPGTIKPIVTPPDPTSPASLEALRGKIAQAIGAQRCAAIDGDLGPTGIATLRGVAAPPVPDTLRKALGDMSIPGGVNWQVVSADSLYCGTLDIMHPLMREFGASTPGLTLGLADGRVVLKDGERIRPHLTMADFKGPLRLDYVAHDGSVQHLYPQVTDTKMGVSGESITRAFAAGEVVKLGDVSPGHPAWEVGEPYGADMIIAIQSSEPLFTKPRPSNVEPAADYLRELRAAVEAARNRGVRMTGNVLVLETVAK